MFVSVLFSQRELPCKRARKFEVRSQQAWVLVAFSWWCDLGQMTYLSVPGASHPKMGAMTAAPSKGLAG